MRLGFEVPRSWVIPAEVLGSQADAEALVTELSVLLPSEGRYVTIPDSPSPKATGPTSASKTAPSGNSSPVSPCGIVGSWADLVRSVRGASYGLVVQKVVRAEVFGASSSVNLITGAEEITVEVAGGEPSGPRSKGTDGRLLERVSAGTRKAASARGTPICLWWSCSRGRLLWRRMLEVDRPTSVASYSREYSGAILPGTPRPLAWSIDSDLLAAAWSEFLKTTFDVAVAPAMLLRRFYGHCYVNVDMIRSASRAAGLPARTIDALMNSCAVEDGFSVALGPSAVALLPRVARRIALDRDFESSAKEDIAKIWKAIEMVSRKDLKEMESQAIIAEIDSVTSSLRRAAELNFESAVRAYLLSKLLRMLLVKLGESADKARFIAEEGVRGNLGIDRLAISAEDRERVSNLHEKSAHHLLLKEQVGVTFQFGYSLYRRCFLAIGEEMVENRLIAEPEDVFMLSLDEVRQIAEGGCSTNTCNDFRLRAMLRKRELADAAEMAPPPVVFGEKAPFGFSSPGTDTTGHPGSGGYAIGPARAISSANETNSFGSGEIAVIPDTGMEWAPMVGVVSGVVARSGSRFSGLMFLAREKGVPAVVLAEGMQDVRDGSTLALDGYRGIVRVMAPDRGWKVAELPDLSRPGRS